MSTTEHGLMEWLYEVLDHYQAIAEAGTAGPWNVDGPWWWEVGDGPRAGAMVTAGAARQDVVIARPDRGDSDVQHIALHHPAAVLADIEAKRARIRLHGPVGGGVEHCDVCRLTYPCPTLRLEASAYAARPGYREEWRP